MRLLLLALLALSVPAAHAEVYMLEAGGSTYPIPYEYGGQVIAMAVDPGASSLLVAVEGDGAPRLVLELPHEVISAGNQSFAVLVDGIETGYMSEPGTGSTVLYIPVHDGTEEVEVIGARVVPELPAAALALALGTAGAAALGRRLRS